jgi:hypothetical protein
MEGVPNVVIIGIGLDIGGVHQSLKDSKKTGNKTYLVANSSRLTIKNDFEKYGLKVVKEFRKASRPDFIRNSPLLATFCSFVFRISCSKTAFWIRLL